MRQRNLPKKRHYGHSCVTALLLFGPPPPLHLVNTIAYETQVREWWMTTQNDECSKKAAHRFIRFYRAWYKDQKQRGIRNGTI